MRRGWTSGALTWVLLTAAVAAMASSPAAGEDQSGTERWQWLADTYWYVPKQYLLALASSPALQAPIPVLDQTVYYIKNYAGGYFWGTTAVSYRRPGSSASDEVSCLQLVGSVTPQGTVHLTFTLLPTGTTDSSPSSQPTVGLGTMTPQHYAWTMENQMSTVAVGDLLLTHWAYMYQCKPHEPCFAELPGARMSVPEFLAPCLSAAASAK
jgi:hypothetical protein